MYLPIITISQKGSHIKIKTLEEAHIAIIPDHQEIRYGTFKSIMRQLHMDENDFLDKTNAA